MPFIHMFGNTFTDVPIVAISIDSSLKPEKEWALGAAVAELRLVDVPLNHDYQASAKWRL